MSGLFTGEDAEKAGGARPVCLIQPPFTQLNTPYPSLYYLKSFLEKRGCQVLVRDHSIGLFERVFCRAGLERIFADAEIALMGNRGQSPGSRQRPEQNPIVERFLSEADRWIAVIDRLISFLRGKDREWAHFLSLANGVLPGGPRFDACLESLNGSPLPEDAPLLAGKLLADLADFITHTLDPNFSLVRYAGRTGAALRDFTSVKQSLDGYILKNFYRPYLEEEWDHLTGFSSFPAGTPPLIGITIPFPGCLAGALVCGASAKQRFGGKAAVIAGGGYVNTELRFADDPAVFDYVDYLSFDRGYGSWEAILENINMENDECQKEPALYKTMYRSGAGKIIADPAIADPVPKFAENNSNTARFRRIDDESIKNIFPDYRDADFSRYLYPVDDVNPMHRLWSDGHWLKAYLAHGCYWHGCAFCDLSLDYIRSYQPVDTAALFHHLVEQAEQTGVHGVHLVDEAAPVSSLVQLAELNRDAGLPLTFWGNIRFEKAFTPDIAAILAAGGLVGISAGIEVATPAGFKRLGKGIVLEDVVRSCAAFKEAGILTHAYLIYGYWDQDEQEIIDSAEILRQLFAAELLDSAFWHQFVLTRHSRIYAEWKRGLHPELRVSGDHSGSNNAKPIFALNDLSFEGEEKFNKYTEPLDRLLASWLAQDLAESGAIAPVTAAFPFRVKEPSVSADTVAELLDSYARDRDEDRGTPPAQHGANFPLRGEVGKPETADRVLFLGSRPRISGAGENAELSWRWRLGEHRLRAGSGAKKIAVLLCENSTRNSITAAEFYNNLKDCLGEGETQKAWQTLREGGLAIVF
ncbi:radical SAM protein [Spirochaetia bacterium]|nr:radical SAM protein [Spirochaetia bacterium]